MNRQFMSDFITVLVIWSTSRHQLELNGERICTIDCGHFCRAHCSLMHTFMVSCYSVCLQDELYSTFGIQFNSLFTITNMPIKRFADFLYRRGELKDYMSLLVRNFNPAALKVRKRLAYA